MKRRSDPENFGARITRFGVVVEKIWNFVVLGAKLGFLKVSGGLKCEFGMF
jgi:hypothetical protein